MDDYDTDEEEREVAAFDLSKGEARVVIAALEDKQMIATGERERRMRNVQDHLAAEFDFDEYRNRDRGEMAGEEAGWSADDWFGDDLFGDDDEETVELSREEADDVTAALAAFELDDSHENAGAAENVRERIVDAFDDSDAE